MSERKLRASVAAAGRTTQMLIMTTERLNAVISRNGGRKELRKKLKLAQ